MRHDTTEPRRLLLVVADGVRPDVLAQELDAGRAPTLAMLRERGSYHAVTSSFPSVTGPAYVPFLMGRHPARVGLPGLRWYDRARTLRFAPSQSRSYAGIDIWHVDRDVDRAHPTLLELATPSLAGMSMLGRGATHGRIGRGVAWMLRAAPSHFRGDLLGWRTVERQATEAFLQRFARVRPRMAVLAVTSPDKFAHKFGPTSEPVRAAIGDLDAAVARARDLAAQGGWLDGLHIWVVGDHGHAGVSQHDDLHGWLEQQGLRVLAHPRLGVSNPDVALMVGGNAMAHLYLAPGERQRRWWSSHAAAWDRTVGRLLDRPSVDLLVVAESPTCVRVHHATRGAARIHRDESVRGPRWSYEAVDGDPLRLGGSLPDLDASAAWDACDTCGYPDALVQLSWLGTAAKAGDIIVSASEGWDLRARFEPVPHVSTHGALLAEQMLVPLLLDVPPTRRPQRTADVVPSALDLLAVSADTIFDGRSFLR